MASRVTPPPRCWDLGAGALGMTPYPQGLTRCLTAEMGLASKEECGDGWQGVTKIIKELENTFRGDILGAEHAITS